MLTPPVLQGPTVTLRLLSLDDAGALAERETRGRLPFATLWNGRPVGSTSYLGAERWRWPAGSPHQRSDRPDVVEIGATWLAASAQRTRCNTEAKLLMLAHAFERIGCVRVEFRVNVPNHRSRTAVMRLGAREEGIMRHKTIAVDGRLIDWVYYSILAEEWPAVKVGLEQKLAAHAPA